MQNEMKGKITLVFLFLMKIRLSKLLKKLSVSATMHLLLKYINTTEYKKKLYLFRMFPY